MYREKLLGDQPRWLLKYVSSMEDDREIALEVIEVLKAHVKHLLEIKVIPSEEAGKIISTLSRLEENPQELFSIEAEDIHEAIEVYLKREVGEGAGWLSLGRSRNDHVAAALRIHMKRLVRELMISLIELRRALINKAKEHIETPIPMLMHLQPAQPITLAHYLLYIEEEISSHFTLLKSTLTSLIDKSPLGAAAGAGTSLPINRWELARKLGFNDLALNTLYATSSRSFLTITSSIITNLMVALSRVAEDFIIMCTPQFNYFKPPTSHLATSNIMPQKRNLVTMEILRARAGECIGLLNSLFSILKSTPSGYNLDLQELSRSAWKIARNAIESIKVISDFIEKLEVNKEVLASEVDKYMMLTADLVESLSIKAKIPHREAYKVVAEAIKKCRDLKELIDYLRNKLTIKFDFPIKAINAIELKSTSGSPSKVRVLEMLGAANYRLTEDMKWLSSYFSTKKYGPLKS